ncbi:carboxypeptidase regulatory-like domain-containing protein [Granulicella sp. S190]|uniref:carboxypeptidase regulatory-like domain-containing protein n=1 Tax=Granulicella sp. S190 TaxID=1747226 RepID=UPI00131E2D7B|nr:carboxypeptidase regulatory-like domain-containing protein [Granulicella sp. S190]
MQRPQVKIALLSLMLLTAAVGVAVGQNAAVSGVVRDAQGVAQLGALVQVIAADSAMAGTAFTDLHGRYFIPHLLPGQYEVRASAALFVPAMRGNLELRAGAQAVVNLTLSTLFESTSWLPAERRRADEPGDDWKWTLRSVANRPILRLTEDGDVIVVSSSARETPKRAERVRAEMTAGDGGFGSNGVHSVFAFDRVLDDGAGLTLHADIGTQPGAPSIGQSTEIATGYGMRLGPGGAARTVLSYQAHPEIVGSGGTSGLEVMQMASGQQMQLGDMVDVEAGGTIYVVRTSGYASGSRPFLKVMAHPTENWSVGYRMATSQDLQSFSGLDTVKRELPVAVLYQGRMQTEGGLHQEFTVGRKTGRGMVQLSYYTDALNRVAVSGGGALTTADIAQTGQTGASGIVADATTGTFRFLSAGYKAQGLNVMLTEPLTTSLWLALEYGTGAGLAAKDGIAVALPSAGSDLAPVAARTATVALRGKVLRSGTTLRAAYRWQPSRLVTAVDPYAAFNDQAFLSCYLRQALRLGNLLPPGLEATVDVTNLLAQGYRPFLSEDGQTLFLAQSPRTVQAGLAFTF